MSFFFYFWDCSVPHPASLKAWNWFVGGQYLDASHPRSSVWPNPFIETRYAVLLLRHVTFFDWKPCSKNNGLCIKDWPTKSIIFAGPKRGRPTGRSWIFGLYIRLSVRPPDRLYDLVVSYTANILKTPKVFQHSEPPIKLLLGGLIRVAPDPPNPP